MPRPRGGNWLEDEILELKHDGVDILVCLLTEAEIKELSLSAEAHLCQEHGIQYISFPILDYGLPDSPTALHRLTQGLVEAIESGKSVAIHCRAGIGRSSTVAASILCAIGTTAENAFDKIQAARGAPVPDTQAQRQFIIDMYQTPGRNS